MNPKIIASALAIFALMFSLGYVATSKATNYAYDSNIKGSMMANDLQSVTASINGNGVGPYISCELEAQAVVAAQRAYNLTYQNARIPQEARNAIDATLGAARKVLADCQRRAAASRR